MTTKIENEMGDQIEVYRSRDRVEIRVAPDCDMPCYIVLTPAECVEVVKAIQKALKNDESS